MLIAPTVIVIVPTLTQLPDPAVTVYTVVADGEAVEVQSDGKEKPQG